MPTLSHCYTALHSLLFCGQLAISLGGWGWPSVDKLVLFYRAEAAASAFMRFKGPGVGSTEYSLLNNAKPVKLASVTFYVGSVPIVITPEVDLLVRVAVTEVRTYTKTCDLRALVEYCCSVFAVVYLSISHSSEIVAVRMRHTTTTASCASSVTSDCVVIHRSSRNQAASYAAQACNSAYLHVITLLLCRLRKILHCILASLLLLTLIWVSTILH
jgi:hypothetical protein